MRSALARLAVPMLVATASANAAAEAPDGFAAYLDGVAAEAVAAGLDEVTVTGALGAVTFQDRAIELDRDQPEFMRTFWEYVDSAVSTSRITEGRQKLASHAALLREVEERYGVPPHVLVAFWGLESNFGLFTGDFPVIDVTATLAFDGRREDFFRSELMDALTLLDRGLVQPPLLGSWAGAMGQTQFLPSTLLNHGVDADGDGRIDLWNSLPDIFSSSGHYLMDLGWRRGERWGREVRTPAEFDWSLAELGTVKPLEEWAALGILRVDGAALPIADGIEASLVLPMGHLGPAFLVYGNFRVIMDWNASVFYAIAVGSLADRIAGGGPLVGPRPNLGRALSHTEVEELQGTLASLGFDPGDIDGFAGPNTRAAVRGFQQSVGLPADGYPTLDLLARVRADAGR